MWSEGRQQQLRHDDILLAFVRGLPHFFLIELQYLNINALNVLLMLLSVKISDCGYDQQINE